MYHDVLGLTQQFYGCGNAFRLDSWKGCSHACVYCFSHNRLGKHYPGFQPGDMRVLQRQLELAFGRESAEPGITVELLRHRVPLHFGGMSDPWHPAAGEVSRQFMRELSKYDYPVVISTKGTPNLDDKPWLFDPARVAWQISLNTMQESLARRMEPGAPSPRERVAFMKELHRRGFHTTLRLHAMVSIEDALDVLRASAEHIDFVSAGWLGFTRSARARKAMKDLCGWLGRDLRELDQGSVYWDFPYVERQEGMEQLAGAVRVPLGVGDGDFQHLSTTDNCCGLDTMPKAFDTWLRYNAMTIARTGNKDVWSPRGGLRAVLNRVNRKPGLHTVKDYVDDYLGDFS